MSLRIGIVSDLHGQFRALDLALARMGPIDHLLCAGDVINQFRFSNETVNRLRELDATTVWGNHEAAWFEPSNAAARRSPGIDPAASDWLRSRPLLCKQTLAGVRILLVHATPASPIGEYVTDSGARFAAHFAQAQVEADIVVCGHTHQPGMRRLGHLQVVNPGSVGEGRPSSGGFIGSCAVLSLPEAIVEWHDLPC